MSMHIHKINDMKHPRMFDVFELLLRKRITRSASTQNLRFAAALRPEH